MVLYLDGSVTRTRSLPKLSLNTALVIGAPALIALLDLFTFGTFLVQWKTPALQEWVDIGCFHAAFGGMWMCSVWIALTNWAEESLKPRLNKWGFVLTTLVSLGIYLMGIFMMIGGFGALIYTNVFM